jgi:uncharacterized membrane protein
MSDVWVAIAAMAVATYLCRAGGFWLMGFVRITPRVRGWIDAIPMAVVGAVLGPAALKAGPAEAAGFVAALIATRLFHHDLAGLAAGVGAVALLRALL